MRSAAPGLPSRCAGHVPDVSAPPGTAGGTARRSPISGGRSPWSDRHPVPLVRAVGHDGGHACVLIPDVRSRPRRPLCCRRRRR
jgi:hypothetical protein